MMTAVLLNEARYLEALRSAEVKNSTIKYRNLKADRSISLLYNPATKDGKFSTKLTARMALADGYYEAYPWVEYADSLVRNNANLQIHGWPAYENEGV